MKAHCEDLLVDVADATEERPGFKPRKVKAIRLTLTNGGDAFFVDMNEEIALAFLKTFSEAAQAAWGRKLAPPGGSA